MLLSIKEIEVEKISNETIEYQATYMGLDMVSVRGKTSAEASTNLKLWIQSILKAYNVKHGYMGNLPGEYFEKLKHGE